MRKFALPIAYFFFPWVIVNTILFAMKNKPTGQQPVVGFAILAVGLGVPLASLIVLHRRRAELT